MLDANLKSQLKTYLEKVTQPIEIVASLDDGAKSRELKELLEEIVTLSDRITLTERSDAATRKPSFALTRPGTDISVQFAGIPMGHEFTSLVLALLQVGVIRSSWMTRSSNRFAIWTATIHLKLIFR